MRNTGLLLAVLAFTFLNARGTEEVLEDARRMCANDSVPQALSLLEEEGKEGNRKKSEEALLQLEKGDILLYYAGRPNKAYHAYASVAREEPPQRLGGRAYYGLGLGLEADEQFKRAARAYEKVITNYSESEFQDDAMSAIERCFSKNYQTRVAEVDGYPITELEVEKISSERLSPAEKKQASTEEGRKSLVDRLIYERLLKLAAAEEFAPTESTRVLLKLNCGSCRPKPVMIPGRLSDPQLAKSIQDKRRSILLQRLYKKEVLDKIEVSEKESKRYYRENPERYTISARYTLREIAADTAGLDSALLAFKQGLPFDTVAELYSTAPSASRGGLVPSRPLGSLPEYVRGVAETLKVGARSEPFWAGKHWNLILLEEKTEKTKQPYQEVADVIKKNLKQKKMQKLSQETLQRFRDNAGVDTTTGDTLAKVAGKVILTEDLDAYLETLPLRSPEQAQDSMVRARALSQLIDNMVFDHQLAREKLYLNDSLYQQIESTRQRLMVGAYLKKHVEEKAEPTEEEIEQYYKEHKKEFFKPRRARVREIMVPSADTAEMLAVMIEEGAPFDSLARAYSQAETADRGGYAGYIREGESKKPYRRRAFRLKEGEVSKPVRTQEGYWIVKVEKIIEEHQPDLEESKARIHSTLYKKNKETLENQLRERLMAQAEIKRFDTDREKEPEKSEDKN